MKTEDKGLQFVRIGRPVLFIFVAAVFLLLIMLVKFTVPAAEETVDESEYQILKLVDIKEYTPPPPNVAVQHVAAQPEASDKIQETDDTVIEGNSNSAETVQEAEPDYLPQHKISIIPGIPAKEILSRINYPPIALKQGIEGVVYLELFIDDKGRIRKINVLKDPGYGFAQAAIAAVDGLLCTPALVNGKPVAVRFRYPVRFSLK